MTSYPWPTLLPPSPAASTRRWLIGFGTGPRSHPPRNGYRVASGPSTWSRHRRTVARILPGGPFLALNPATDPQAACPRQKSGNGSTSARGPSKLTSRISSRSSASASRVQKQSGLPDRAHANTERRRRVCVGLSGGARRRDEPPKKRGKNTVAGTVGSSTLGVTAIFLPPQLSRRDEPTGATTESEAIVE